MIFHFSSLDENDKTVSTDMNSYHIQLSNKKSFWIEKI